MFRAMFCSHHQEHLTVFTSSGNIHQCRCRLVSWMIWNAVSTHPLVLVGPVWWRLWKVGRPLSRELNVVRLDYSRDLLTTWHWRPTKLKIFLLNKYKVLGWASACLSHFLFIFIRVLKRLITYSCELVAEFCSSECSNV